VLDFLRLRQDACPRASQDPFVYLHFGLSIPGVLAPLYAPDFSAAGKLAGGAAVQPGSQPPPRPPGPGVAAPPGASAGQLPGSAAQPEAGSRPQTPAASAAAGATPPPVRKMEKPIEVRA